MVSGRWPTWSDPALHRVAVGTDMQRPDPCSCGSPLRAFRVQGRSAEMLTFSTESGRRVTILPLAFELDHIPAVEHFQIVHHTPTRLGIRLELAAGGNQ